MPGDRIAILGVPLDCLSKRDALARLHIATQASGDPLFTVTTLNPEYVIAARGDVRFREAIEHSDLIVCDGIGALIAAKAIHGRTASRISRLTGLDLALTLAKWSGFDDAGGLFLLGGKNAPGAATRLTELAPGARIVGAWSGGTASDINDDESVCRISESGASIVLVAYGAPQQLLWIERNRQALADAAVRAAIGIGGVLDYLSGDADLAPPIVRRAGFEWLYRLFREPWRARRQAVLPVFALLVAREAFRGRLVRKSP